MKNKNETDFKILSATFPEVFSGSDFSAARENEKKAFLFLKFIFENRQFLNPTVKLEFQSDDFADFLRAVAARGKVKRLFQFAELIHFDQLLQSAVLKSELLRRGILPWTISAGKTARKVKVETRFDLPKMNFAAAEKIDAENDDAEEKSDRARAENLQKVQQNYFLTLQNAAVATAAQQKTEVSAQSTATKKVGGTLKKFLFFSATGGGLVGARFFGESVAGNLRPETPEFQTGLDFFTKLFHSFLT